MKEYVRAIALRAVTKRVRERETAVKERERVRKHDRGERENGVNKKQRWRTSVVQ